jgi:uncharacterized protein (DUF2147 family)
MRKALLIAALMMTTSIGVAHAADSWSFQVNGQKVRIERPRNCTSLSCINIVAPGLNNSNSDDDSASNTTTSNPPAPTNQPVASAPVQQPVQQYQQPVQQPVQQYQQPVQQVQQPMQQQVVTAPVATVPPLPGQATTNVTTLPAPTDNQTSVTPPALPQVAQPVQQYQQPVQQYQQPMQQQVATVQPTAPMQNVAPAPVANSPVGVWMTEKNEGKVHVVNCGADICGYAVENNGADGAQVLINMVPDGNSWKGRIHDTRGGGTYDSTIAMRGTNNMRVQGCAFGGMFCGGQTWTRVN